MRIVQKEPFMKGYNSIITMDEHKDMMMDFGILKLDNGDREINAEEKERAYLLMYGKVTFEWGGQWVVAKRESFLDDNPWCLNVPPGMEVKITALEDAEISVHKTLNEDITFTSSLYKKNDCRIEIRGKGTMNEAGTRVVRTILDKSIAPKSNLMLGEDVHYPGKWAGFPSHYHPQPEIYFYKFNPENGFGLLKLGDEAVLLEHNDTVKIAPNLVHPQVAAPGYAMYFIWVIRHLENNPYITPIFEPEHIWVEQKDAKIWPEKREDE